MSIELEKFRGMAISVNSVCPLSLLYIKEMTRALMKGEKDLDCNIPVNKRLTAELEEWDRHPEFLENSRPFKGVNEKDVILHPISKPHEEFMTGLLLKNFLY